MTLSASGIVGIAIASLFVVGGLIYGLWLSRRIRTFSFARFGNQEIQPLTIPTVESFELENRGNNDDNQNADESAGNSDFSTIRGKYFSLISTIFKIYSSS